MFSWSFQRPLLLRRIELNNPHFPTMMTYRVSEIARKLRLRLIIRCPWQAKGKTMKTTLAVAVLAAILISARLGAVYHRPPPRPLRQAWHQRVCLPCHVPHNAPNAAYGPLWNHALTNGNGTSSTFVGPATPNGGFTKTGRRLSRCMETRCSAWVAMTA